MNLYFPREQPVVGNPYPDFVRREIHDLLRRNLRFVTAEPLNDHDTDVWAITYMDGSQRRAVVIYRIDIAA